MVDQTLFNWVNLQRQGRLQRADNKTNISAEQMEISRLRAELARVMMESDILGETTTYFAEGLNLSTPSSNATVAFGRSRFSAVCWA